jgi:hypothetical protein
MDWGVSQSTPGSEENVPFGMEAAYAAPPWTEAQAKLDDLFARLGGVYPAPDFYATLVQYLSDPTAARLDSAKSNGDFAARMACRSDPVGGALDAPSSCRIIGWVREATGGAPVYLADGRAHVREALFAEYPELIVFDIGIENAFAETEVPGLYVETARFADLRSLSRMRREIRRTGLRHPRRDTNKLLAVLLGLT